MRCASRVIGPLAAAAIAASCGPGFENCPGTTAIAAWHDDPSHTQPEETWTGCATSFAQCGGSDAALARSSFCRAMAVRSAGKMEEAVQALERAASLDPGWAPPHAVLGTIALAQGEAQQAVTHLEKALTLEPEWPGTLNDLGLALQLLGNLEGALVQFDAALAFDPLMAGTHANRAGVLVQLGRAQEAMVSYLIAIDLEPGEPLHFYNLAGLFEKTGEWEKAAAAYAALLHLLPKDRQAAVHLKTAMMLEKAGELEEAREHYLAALELAPTSRTALESLAIMSLGTGEHEQAWELFHRLGELAPQETAKTLFSLGSSFIAAGELGLAARAYGIA
ncbi:MAG: tetratricopeptide repeat protein, partial [Deltaproteobacteria bacterium]|nr:tetratricopeptide repeat protein [Deltaproteobacteria bacterium]